MRIKLHLCATVALALLVGAPISSACVTVGLYEDSPASVAPLQRTLGPGITAISTYLTAGKSLDPALVKTANRDRAMLVITWDPDNGSDGATQPGYRLSAVTAGRYDKSLRALVGALRAVKRGAVLRPMPEMNTPWYAWSGLVNGNTPAEYVAAWKRVRQVIHAAPGGARVRLLWAPYASSVPDTASNALKGYFPGASQVDLVGASGYNFGARSGLQWTEPGALFSSAYQAIEALAPKPFWLSETGSTGTGGDQAGWINALATLQATAMPRLAGMLWYDVSDPTGDFQLRSPATVKAFRVLLAAEACR
jgi:hypothetical protein